MGLQVIERALKQVQAQYNTDAEEPTVGVVRLSGLMHVNEGVAFKAIARQLCSEFKVSYSQSASLDENLVFLHDMLKELCRWAHQGEPCPCTTHKLQL